MEKVQAYIYTYTYAWWLGWRLASYFLSFLSFSTFFLFRYARGLSFDESYGFVLLWEVFKNKKPFQSWKGNGVGFERFKWIYFTVAGGKSPPLILISVISFLFLRENCLFLPPAVRDMNKVPQTIAFLPPPPPVTKLAIITRQPSLFTRWLDGW